MRRPNASTSRVTVAAANRQIDFPQETSCVESPDKKTPLRGLVRSPSRNPRCSAPPPPEKPPPTPRTSPGFGALLRHAPATARSSGRGRGAGRLCNGRAKVADDDNQQNGKHRWPRGFVNGNGQPWLDTGPPFEAEAGHQSRTADVGKSDRGFRWASVGVDGENNVTGSSTSSTPIPENWNGSFAAAKSNSVG